MRSKTLIQGLILALVVVAGIVLSFRSSFAPCEIRTGMPLADCIALPETASLTSHNGGSMHRTRPGFDEINLGDPCDFLRHQLPGESLSVLVYLPRH